MLKRVQTEARGHKKGLVIDGHVYPDDAVQDCLNMDFHFSHDEIRKPYAAYKDWTDVVDYAYVGETDNILAFEEFRVRDEESTKLLKAVVVTDEDNQNVRVLIDDWFNPGSDFGNSASGLTSGWTGKQIDILERYEFGMVGTGNNLPTLTMNLSATDVPERVNDYYRGWFLFNNDTGKCVGIVTKYVASTQVITVRVNIEVIDEEAEGINNVQHIEFPLASPTDMYMLCRFAYCGYYMSNMGAEAISEAQIQPDNNGIRISFGKSNLPMLMLTYLEQTTYFQREDATPDRAANWGSGDDEYNRDWHGFWASADMPVIENKKNYWDTASGAGDTNKIHYYESNLKNLGLILQRETNYDTSNDDIVTRAGAICVELDDYQMVFLRTIILRNIASSNRQSFYRFRVLFKVDFDRRITHTAMFYGESVYTETDVADTPMMQLADARGGYDDIRKDWGKQFTEPTLAEENTYEVLVLTPENQKNRYEGGWLRLSEDATGLTINSYLNNYYYRDVSLNGKLLFRIGDMNALLDVKDITTGNDDEDVKNGSYKMCLSQVQNGNVNTRSIFVNERIREISATEKVIAGMGTIGDSFLVWTDKQVASYTIAEYATAFNRKDISFTDRGAYSHKSVVRAQINYNFAGAYWLSPSGSIYRLVDNYPEDILFGRWRDYYQEQISEQDKEQAVGGFLSRTKEVFFQIGNKIYIWNLEYEHWKVYQYGDTASIFAKADDSEIAFVAGGIAYKTEGMNTEEYMDKSSEPIPFGFKKAINFGDETLLKIFDRADLIFERELAEEDLPASIELKAGVNSRTATDVLDTEYNIAATQKLTQQVRTRKPGNYYNFQLSGSGENLKRFRLVQLKLIAAITQRQLTEI